MPRIRKKVKFVESLRHDQATRKNIPTAEHWSVMEEDQKQSETLRYPRNPDLDPQLVWRGKDERDWSDLVVHAPPLYIQEKVHPKVLIDDLLRRSEEADEGESEEQFDLFADFNGIEESAERTEFYQHDQNWSNRMILGDSLQVMASLAEREGLRGQVQCIYLDPPYGIKFRSNFQWSTASTEVIDGKLEHITREPEQVRAFRDTWRDGIHSYLTYLRDRLTVARDLLHESGSIFVQIGDERVHLIKSLLTEVFGEGNYVNTIAFKKKGATLLTESVFDFLVWFAKDRDGLKLRPLYNFRREAEVDPKYNTLIGPGQEKVRITGLSEKEIDKLLADGWRWARVNYPIVSQDPHERRSQDYLFHDSYKSCGSSRHWTFDIPEGMDRLAKADRIFDAGGASLAGIVYHKDRPAVSIGNLWDDVKGEENSVYVVQTAWRIVQRAILMTSDPGDLLLDPTCGSGTTAYLAEQWGRRWITIDTSRVALALARARLMGARYAYYLLADSREGKEKIAEITRSVPAKSPSHNYIRHGFVYERVPEVTLKSIAHDAEIDVIWEKYYEQLEPVQQAINEKTGLELEEWQIPREPGDPWPLKAKTQHKRFQRVTTDATKQKAVNHINEILGRSYTIETLPLHPVDPWEDEELLDLHRRWWELRIERQKEIDASIAAKADFEYLYDKPYEDPDIVRVAGPFTVESLSPHRVLAVDENDELIDPLEASEDPGDYGDLPSFEQVILENLRTAGVQQAHKEDRIEFTSLTGWPGDFICAEGRYQEGDTTKRAGIFLGPEFGTVSRPDLVEAAREAGDAGFDVLIACAFNYEAHASEFHKLGRIPVLKARMNADLHMAEDLKNTGKGNLFVIFGEPDIEISEEDDDQLRVQVNGVDVFDPSTGEIRSDDVDGIACWFVDTDYNGESFFVRQAYFLGANDPYKSLKTTLKAEINEEAWETLHSAVSRPFDRPESGRIAVKVINHLGDEVMKVFRVD